jgi:hypothetical protein
MPYLRAGRRFRPYVRVIRIMPENDRVILRNHRLRYLGDLRIHESIFQARFQSGCATNRCKANCCRRGVWVDVAERDAIAASADLIRRHMEPSQEQDPERWFDSEVRLDPDFPSGKCVGTAVRNDACIFLDGAGLCVLQRASQQNASRNELGNLKPFFCIAFPIDINDAELSLDRGDDLNCCAPAADGELNVLGVCSEELKHVLGGDAFAELERLHHSRADLAKRPTSQ